MPNPPDYGHSRWWDSLHPGMLEFGNIDLANRPTVKNADGSISTVRSISVGVDNGQAVLIPTVVGDKVVSNDEAIKHWQQTGQHLGVFANEDSANAYAERLHEDQARQYLPQVAPTQRNRNIPGNRY